MRPKCTRSAACPNAGEIGWPHECMYCWLNAKGRGNYRNHRHHRALPAVRQKTIEEVCIVKRPEHIRGGTLERAAVPEGSGFDKLPAILEYLTTVQYEDGTAREPSSLAVSIADGTVRLALNDKELKQSLYTAAGSLREALQLMDKALAAGQGEWRPWKTGKKR